MTIQSVGYDSVALTLDERDLRIHGVRLNEPDGLDIRLARDIVDSALRKAGMTPGVVEIEVFAGGAGMMMFARLGSADYCECVAFGSLDAAADAARSAPPDAGVESELFSMNGTCLMIIHGAAGAVDRVLAGLLEFGGRRRHEPNFDAYIREHGRLMIKGQAIERLRMI